LTPSLLQFIFSGSADELPGLQVLSVVPLKRLLTRLFGIWGDCLKQLLRDGVKSETTGIKRAAYSSLLCDVSQFSPNIFPKLKSFLHPETQTTFFLPLLASSFTPNIADCFEQAISLSSQPLKNSPNQKLAIIV
jgi:hypothetical protein